MDFAKIQQELLGKHIFFTDKGTTFKMQISRESLTSHPFDSSHCKLRLSARHGTNTFCAYYEFDLHDLHKACKQNSSVRSIPSPDQPTAITISFKQP